MIWAHQRQEQDLLNGHPEQDGMGCITVIVGILLGFTILGGMAGFAWLVTRACQ